MLALAHLVWGSAQNYRNRTAWKAADEYMSGTRIHSQDFCKTFSGWLPRCFELLLSLKKEKEHCKAELLLGFQSMFTFQAFQKCLFTGTSEQSANILRGSQQVVFHSIVQPVQKAADQGAFIVADQKLFFSVLCIRGK